MIDFAQQRQNMVASQVLPNRVGEPRLVRALGELPREIFVPAPLKGVAYVDEDIALGGGRYVIEPLVLARLLQAADAASGDTVLDVGCTTGYGAALMARLARKVVALESDGGLAEQARANLAQVGLANAEVVVGPLAEGYPAQAPYQVILIEGAVEEVPPALMDQIAEQGRLVAVIERRGVGKGMLYRRDRGVVASLELFDAAVPVLPGMAAAPRFAF